MLRGALWPSQRNAAYQAGEADGRLRHRQLIGRQLDFFVTANGLKNPDCLYLDHKHPDF
jgi:hypothetical protein